MTVPWWRWCVTGMMNDDDRCVRFAHHGVQDLGLWLLVEQGMHSFCKSQSIYFFVKTYTHVTVKVLFTSKNYNPFKRWRVERRREKHNNARSNRSTLQEIIIIEHCQNRDDPTIVTSPPFTPCTNAATADPPNPPTTCTTTSNRAGDPPPPPAAACPPTKPTPTSWNRKTTTASPNCPIRWPG